jgi:hypothetical protein
MKKTPKNAEKNECELCDFKCSKKSDYKRHTSTDKHKILQNTTKYYNKNAEFGMFICDCDRSYKHHSSLWNHKKICTFEKQEEIQETNQNQDVSVLTNLVIELVKSNGELQKQVIEICKNGTTNNSTNNSHNKTFNLQLYLNEMP